MRLCGRQEQYLHHLYEVVWEASTIPASPKWGFVGGKNNTCITHIRLCGRKEQYLHHPFEVLWEASTIPASVI
ncbi:hypothetical protein DPMN_185436 [Dreissena polymorpha]|uniref:Uncharacterized protein n=1 Tax=Dreissena polymorpha TaxID=45954 RepID=A0A9D4DKY6_DREPO|nr:hypothetical protein DPMN_185436 [Dreissena polymorpha]